MSADIHERILVVASDESVVELVVETASRSPAIRVSRAHTAAEALDLDRNELHHVVVADIRLTDMSGLDFVGRLLARRRRPVILYGDRPTTDDVVAAMRLGVADFLATPLDPLELADAMTRCVRRDAVARREIRRWQRLRHLLRRVLRDRRCLNQRIELICRDMVGAQRSLFKRVLSLEDRNSFSR